MIQDKNVFPTVIIDIILEYSAEYKLLSWIDEDKIDWLQLSRNPAAIHLLEQNPDKIHWKELSENPNIFKLTINREIKQLLY